MEEQLKTIFIFTYIMKIGYSFLNQFFFTYSINNKDCRVMRSF